MGDLTQLINALEVKHKGYRVTSIHVLTDGSGDPLPEDFDYKMANAVKNSKEVAIQRVGKRN